MADELISRQKIIKLLELLARHEDDFRQSVILGVVHTIKHAPAVDAVEVVRCGKCKHYEDHKRKVYENCIRDGRLVPMKPTDFCSYGVRREENA